jgi:hypothetical protein
MTRPVSAIYQKNHPELELRLQTGLVSGIERSNGGCTIFFRADDIGFPSQNFMRLIGSFKKHRIPLCLATVPAWLNEARLDELYTVTGKLDPQWCWHQHGVTHRNFEQTGKKQEFGPSRSPERVMESLGKGREKLKDLLKDDFYPVFTPPWNRCTAETMAALSRLGFRAISRSTGARPESPAELTEIPVNVDLHTRKESGPETGLNNFLEELTQAVASGCCGVMIHHQRMNAAAFNFLDQLLAQIRMTGAIRPVHFKDILS